MQLIFERGVARVRFSMPNLCQEILVSGKAASLLSSLVSFKDSLGERVVDSLLLGALRASFLIELVKEPQIETTKFETRWARSLNDSDPRKASYDECLAVFKVVLDGLVAGLAVDPNKELFCDFQKHKILPYEVPVDYKERRQTTFIHRRDNVQILLDEVPRRVIKLRSILSDAAVHSNSRLFEAIYDKIRTKTYLTDRVLTGVHKTNREKRWEVHPASVHFALRHTCFEIEYELIRQLTSFEGFPLDLLQHLVGQNLIPSNMPVFRCPITQDIMRFADFEREVRDPIHGKSKFQVGHLNPLKNLEEGDTNGHTAKNISWVSADGNRIQGHLSLEETRSLLKRLVDNYKTVGLS